MRRAASALLAGLLLAACASNPQSTGTPAPSIPRGLEQIAASYLKLVDDSNAATCSYNAVLSQSAPALADLTRASADYAMSLESLGNGLADIEWLAGLGGDANELIQALAVNQGFAEGMAGADTMSTFITADNQLIEANKASAAAATQLRTDLGLGSAGDPCST
jgi:hypothetical protein